MAIENNIIKSPVHLVANVANILRCNDTRLSALCKHPNVNKWSRHKPVSFDGIPNNVIDETRWKGSDNRSSVWGLKVNLIPTNGAYNGIDSYAQPSNPNYEWDKPLGNYYKSPFRLGDFSGYYHNAKPFEVLYENNGAYVPMDYNSKQVLFYSTGDVETQSISFKFRSDSHPNSIRLSDLRTRLCESDEELFLVASVYDGDDLIAEYYNDNLKLGYSGSRDTSLYSETEDTVKVKFDAASYWNKGISQVNLCLSLQVVKWSSMAGSFFATKIMALPLEDVDNYIKQYQFMTAYRYVRAVSVFQNNVIKNWVTPISNTEIMDYDIRGNMYFCIEVSRGNTDLTFKFNDTSTCFITRYKVNNQLVKETYGILSDVNHSDQPTVTQVTIPKAITYDDYNEYYPVYSRFGAMLGDGTVPNSGYYTVELHLKIGTEITQVATITLFVRKQS